MSALASLHGGRLSILAWHHHDDDVPGPAADVELSLSGLPAGDGPVLLEHFHRASDGASLRTNVALVLANARLGGQVAASIAAG